jgi:hypothetical protein
LNLTIPHRISAAAAETGRRRDAPGLLKLPRKSQLRTGSCNQVSRVCPPNGRHGRLVKGAAIERDCCRRPVATVDGCGRRRRQSKACDGNGDGQRRQRAATMGTAVGGGRG